jgi:predicted aspartyl protease
MIEFSFLSTEAGNLKRGNCMGYRSYLLKTLGVLSLALGISSCIPLPGTPVQDSPESRGTANSASPAAPPAAAPDNTAENSAASSLGEARAVEAAPGAAAAEPSSQRDYFREGVNRASSAVAIGQSAQSTDDWTLAVNRWQQAVTLLEQVPTTSDNYDQAQTKIQEYRNHLASAQQRASGQPAVAAQAEPARPDGLVARIPIVERRGGTPIVSVAMKGQNGSSTFPMLFDTGATGTLITQEMANALGVVVVDEIQARIADGSVVTLPIGYLTSMEVGGLRKEGMLVAIGGSVGLLGQDFYGEYGIAVGGQVINLHE